MGERDGLMKIGEVAKKTGLTLRTIRYYEELGLVNPQERSRGGFRLYDEEDLAKIHIVHRLQELNLSLKEIGTLLLARNEHKTKGEIARSLLPNLKSHLSEAERKRNIYQTITRDFLEGIKILSECQNCTRIAQKPHCEKYQTLLSEGNLPILIRSLF